MAFSRNHALVMVVPDDPAYENKPSDWNAAHALADAVSGGIPFFSSTTAEGTSGLLAANALMVGGGAGAAPSTVTTGTGVLTALGIAVGSAGAFVTFNGALGTPSSGTLTNVTGLPTAGILDDAVTYAKIQNVTSARLLGRATAGAGNTEEITLGTNLSFTGTTLNAVSATGITIGTTTITSGTSTRVIYDLAGVVQETSTLIINATAGQGPSIVAGTATTAVGPFSLTQTRNNAGVDFPGVVWTFTDTALGADSNNFRIMGGAAGDEQRFAVSADGLYLVFGSGGASGGGFVLAQGSFLAFSTTEAEDSSIVFQPAGNTLMYGLESGFQVVAGKVLGFAPDTPDAATTAFSELSAGNMALGTGAQGSFAGGLKLTTLTLDGLAITKGYTVAGLPAGVQGAVCHVTDQLTAVAAKGVAPTGGGSVKCAVFYNGSAWVGI